MKHIVNLFFIISGEGNSYRCYYYYYITMLFYLLTAYAYSQGASQAVIGILMALSAVIGLIASLVYPRMRKRIGEYFTSFLSGVDSSKSKSE